MPIPEPTSARGAAARTASAKAGTRTSRGRSRRARVTSKPGSSPPGPSAVGMARTRCPRSTRKRPNSGPREAGPPTSGGQMPETSRSPRAGGELSASIGKIPAGLGSRDAVVDSAPRGGCPRIAGAGLHRDRRSAHRNLLDLRLPVRASRVRLPQKEINFFSRERNWGRGFDWYEAIFSECAQAATVGEFSTSYLTDAEAARPDPRALSRGAAHRLPARSGRAGLLELSQRHRRRRRCRVDPLHRGAGTHPEYVEGGRYAHYLPRYLELFRRDQLLVSIFDQARRDPLAPIQAIYRFLGRRRRDSVPRFSIARSGPDACRHPLARAHA